MTNKHTPVAGAEPQSACEQHAGEGQQGNDRQAGGEGQTGRERLTALLLNEDPLADFGDDEILFQRVINDYADYAKLLVQEHERQDSEKQAAEQLRSNIEDSMLALEQLKSDSGCSDGDIEAAVSAVKRMAAEASEGRFSTESVRAMIRAINYDADVKRAGDEGELRGRNAEIEKRMPVPDPSGDGIPHLDSGSPMSSYRSGSIFDIAREA